MYRPAAGPGVVEVDRPARAEPDAPGESRGASRSDPERARTESPTDPGRTRTGPASRQR